MAADLSWLTDILIAARRILRFVDNVNRDSFLGNEEKRFAVYAQIVIIGEAANRISNEFQEANPEIPWRKVVGMRNRIVHAYDDVDWEIVWQVATDSMPELVRAVEPLVSGKSDAEEAGG